MSETNIIRLSDKLNDGRKDSVSDMLKDAMERVKENPQIKKAIVLLWNEDADLDKQVLWHQAGLSRSEHFHLLSIAKDDYLLEFALDHTH